MWKLSYTYSTSLDQYFNSIAKYSFSNACEFLLIGLKHNQLVWTSNWVNLPLIYRIRRIYVLNSLIFFFK